MLWMPLTFVRGRSYNPSWIIVLGKSKVFLMSILFNNISIGVVGNLYITIWILWLAWYNN